MSPVQEARDLREGYWNVDGMISFPVDPYWIARQLGIEVSDVELPPTTAGFILREDDGVTRVFINEADHEVRRRFTLAHELGHFVHHRDDEKIGFVDLRDELASTGTDLQEIWANRFAAELLMPAATIIRWWAEGMSVDDIRAKLNVSKPALAHRIKNLGLL